ncbi:MAG TPA: hypothetical protein VLH61_06100, partial [Bacteroidales bacterium]|nr:hypothetical protein [Bacteroidales bacterium]
MIFENIYKVFSLAGKSGLRVLLLLSAHALAAQSARFELYPDSILIGQRSMVTIELELRGDPEVIWPPLTGSLARNIEVVSFGSIDTVMAGNGLITLRQQLEITSFEPGFHAIPPLIFTLVNNSDSLVVESEPHLLIVQGVDVPQEATPYDIKPIFRMPVSLAEILRIVLPAMLILGTLAGITFWLKRYFKRKPPVESIWEKAEIPAHVAAISSLEGLKNKNLWQNGKHKQYHSELTFIIRMYIEKRFGLHALEMTSGEIISRFPEFLDESGLLSSVSFILETGDLVKFAKYIPKVHENEDCMAKALDFVWRTV